MIANTFIERPVTSIVISLVIVLLGVLAVLQLPVGQYPDITPPTVQITGSFNGADAQTVEQTVTTPIESQVNGTPGMAKPPKPMVEPSSMPWIASAKPG